MMEFRSDFQMAFDSSKESIIQTCEQGKQARSKLFESSFSEYKKNADQEIEEDAQDNQSEQKFQSENKSELNSSNENPQKHHKLQENQSNGGNSLKQKQSEYFNEIDQLNEKSNQLVQLYQNSLINIRSNKRADGTKKSNLLENRKVPYTQDFIPAVWKKKAFYIIGFVNRFQFNLQRCTLLFKPEQLSQVQLSIINDKSSKGPQEEGWGEDTETYSTGIKGKCQFLIDAKLVKNLLKQIKQIQRFIGKAQFIKVGKNLLGKINNILPVFHSHNFLLIIWTVFIFIMKILLIFYIPFSICFYNDEFFSSRIKGNLIPILMMIDSVISSNTSFFDSGILIEERFLIIMNFIKEKFFIQATIMIILFNNYDENVYISLFVYILLMIESLSHCESVDYIRNKMEISIKMSGFRDLVELFSQIVYFNHIFACIIHQVSVLEFKRGNPNWLETNDLINSTFFSRYISSFYYGTITMCTVGYGDYHPYSDNEKIVTIILAFLSSGIFGYTLNSIGSIIMQLGKREKQYKHEMAELNNFMQDHNVDPSLQNQARKYAQFIYNQDLDIGKESSQNCLQILSKGMQEHILKNIFYQQLNKIPFLKNNFSLMMLQSLAIRVQQKMLGPGDYLIQTGDKIEPTIFIVQKGKIQISTKQSKYNPKDMKEENISIFRTLQQGEYFGQLEFFTCNQQALFSVSSIGISNILLLTLSDFLIVLEQGNNPNDKESFNFLRDNCIFSKQYDKIDQSCFSCHSVDHMSFNCPFLVYGGDQYQMLRHLNQQEAEFRRSFLRKRAKLITFKDFAIVQEQALNWFQENKVYRNKYIEVFFLDEEEEETQYDENGITCEKQELLEIDLIELKLGREREKIESDTIKTIKIINDQDDMIDQKQIILTGNSGESFAQLDSKEIYNQEIIEQVDAQEALSESQISLKKQTKKVKIHHIPLIESQKKENHINISNRRSSNPIKLMNVQEEEEQNIRVHKGLEENQNYKQKTILQKNQFETNPLSSQEFDIVQSPLLVQTAESQITAYILEIQRDLQLLLRNTNIPQTQKMTIQRGSLRFTESDNLIVPVPNQLDHVGKLKNQEKQFDQSEFMNDDYDKIQSFEIYFPYFNIENIQDEKKKIPISGRQISAEDLYNNQIMKKKLKKMVSKKNLTQPKMEQVGNSGSCINSKQLSLIEIE